MSKVGRRRYQKTKNLALHVPTPDLLKKKREGWAVSLRNWGVKISR